MAAPKLDSRRIAADARRIAEAPESKRTEVLREALKVNYERGRRVGREEMKAELSQVDGKRALLEMGAAFAKLVAERMEKLDAPAEMRACTEAAAIIQDAATMNTPGEHRG